MTNLQCVIAVLTAHREARHWSDEAVASDLLAQLGLDPGGEAKNAAPVVDPSISEAEVVAAEAAAKEATDKANAARAVFDATDHESDASEDEGDESDEGVVDHEGKKALSLSAGAISIPVAGAEHEPAPPTSQTQFVPSPERPL